MKTAENTLQKFNLETKLHEGQKRIKGEESKPEGSVRLMVGLNLRSLFQSKQSYDFAWESNNTWWRN